MTVLETQRTLYAAQGFECAIAPITLNASIALYKALGRLVR